MYPNLWRSNIGKSTPASPNDEGKPKLLTSIFPLSLSNCEFLFWFENFFWNFGMNSSELEFEDLTDSFFGILKQMLMCKSFLRKKYKPWVIWPYYNRLSLKFDAGGVRFIFLICVILITIILWVLIHKIWVIISNFLQSNVFGERTILNMWSCRTLLILS